MHLVEGFANRNTPFFKFHLYQWQAIDQNRHVVAISVRPSLLKLLDYLNLIASNVLLVEEANVLDATIVENEVVHIVIVNLAGFLDDSIARSIQPGLDKTQPFAI